MSQLHDGKGDNVNGNKTSIYNIQLGAFLPVVIVLIIGIILYVLFIPKNNPHKNDINKLDTTTQEKDSIAFNIFVIRLHHFTEEGDTFYMDMTVEEQLHLLKSYEELGLYLNIHYMDSILPPLRIEKGEEYED